MARIRHDIATPTLGQDADAETQPWHPVLDTHARGVELMSALPMDNPQSWLWAATPTGSPWALRRGRRGASAPTPRSSTLVFTHDGDWDSVPDTDGTAVRSTPAAHWTDGMRFVETLSLDSSRCTLHDTRTLALGGVPRDPVPRLGPGQVPSIGVTEAEVER